MKIKIFSMLVLAMITLFFIACGDSNTTVKNKNCANACDKTWQQCNEDTQKCEPKDGFCADDEGCKADATKPKCNGETHLCVADKCSDDPCKDNTEAGNTVCELDASDAGFSCVCEEGFELVENKCVEKTVNPCDAEPCKDNTDGKTICKVDENAENGYVCEEEEVTDKCDPNPCKDNEDGQTVCEEADNTEGYTCSCEEGFKLVEGKCTEQTCSGTNECDTLDVTKCDGDKLVKCSLDDTTYCTVWKEVEICDADKCIDESEGVAAHCEVECDNTCDNLDATKCTGDRLFKCVTDDTTYCTVWKEQEDCGAGLCADNSDGAAYCKCQECDPNTFNSVCSEDLNSFDYCDNTDGCFTIKTITCDAGKHCGEPDANGNLSCVETTCSDECNEGEKKCETASNATFLVECKKAADACYYWDNDNRVNCTVNNMTCSEYDGEYQCLGGQGSATCQSSNADNRTEILMNGIWVGNTQNQGDNYQGCNGDDFDGQDAVYTIEVNEGANLNLTVKKLEDNNGALKVTPSVYVMRGNCNNNNYCEAVTASDDSVGTSATLSLTNLSAGKYHIIVDSDKVDLLMTSTDSYKYELTVDLQ